MESVEDMGMKVDRKRYMKRYKFFFLATAALMLVGCQQKQKATVEEAYKTPAPAFCADSAFAYAEKQCEFGPRVVGSEAHRLCGEWIAIQFERFGGRVQTQEATFSLYDGTKVKGRNIIATFGANDSTEAAGNDHLMICAHWDSRPWADNDPDERNWHTPVMAANDGASGVAVLIELARIFGKKQPPMAVDLVCFDAEDCGVPQWVDTEEDTENTWCLGSQLWAKQPHVDVMDVRYAILLDMVGSKETEFRKEGFSLRYAPSVTDKVWTAAQRMGHGKMFTYDEGGYVTDDHLPLNRAGVLAIDIVGNNPDGSSFPAIWHTVDDNMQHLSTATLQAVGETVADVIYSEEK